MGDKRKMTAELKGIHAKTFQDLDVIKDVLKLDEEKIADLEEENAEAKNLIEELASSLSVVGECGEEECELINKAQKFINKPIF